MIVERTADNRIVITLSSDIDADTMKRIIDYIRYLEAASKSKATQGDADKLAEDINAKWWEENKSRFIK